MNLKVLASSSKGNAVLVTSGDQSLLIDAGISMRQLRERSGLNLLTIDAVLITHEHGDHAASAKALSERGLTVFGLAETRDNIGADLMSVVEPGKTYKVNGWMFVPFSVHHDVPNVGYLIKAPDGDVLFYATDTHRIDGIPKGANIIAIEANHSLGVIQASEEFHAKRAMRTHLSEEAAIAYVQKWQPHCPDLREVHFLHRSGHHAGGNLAERASSVLGVECFDEHSYQ